MASSLNKDHDYFSFSSPLKTKCTAPSLVLFSFLRILDALIDKRKAARPDAVDSIRQGR